jgi:hypothetical protein
VFLLARITQEPPKKTLTATTMAFSLSARNPRTLVFIGVLALVSLLMLANIYSTPGGHFVRSIEDSRYLARGPQTYLESFLAHAEAQYQEAIQMRTAYIERWEGPDGLVLFPEDWHFYTIWDFVIPAFSCPHQRNRYGILGDGGKWVCGLEKVIQRPQCVVYSFGVSTESSFEAAILSKSPNCEIWGYDYSVNKWGDAVGTHQEWAGRLNFKPYKLDATDNHEANPPLWTLQSLMKANGHTFIDILKIDIEGAEFEVLSAWIDYLAERKEPLPIGQMQIEIHAAKRSFLEFLGWWEKLEAAGLRPFFTEPNLPAVNFYRGAADVAEWSFINIAQKHYLISDN